MPDFTIRADSVDVEQIMRQIRGRIRDKRGVDYTEEQIRELAAAKLERFLDPTGIRSDLLEQFRTRPSLPPGFLYQFEDTTLFDSDKPIVRFFRRLLHPFLKLLFNPNVLSNTLHKQAAFNQYVHAHQPLQFELLHNLVLELTRASIEVKNLKMRLESVQSRLEFNERRARALEAVVQYKPDATPAGRGGRDEGRRDARGESPRGSQGQPRAPQPQAQTQPRPPQQQQARPFQRSPLPPGEAAVALEQPPTPGTEPQGGVDPITGGDSLRTRRRRRRRGRRSSGEGDAGTSRAASGPPDATGEDAGLKPGPTYDAASTHSADRGTVDEREVDPGTWGTASAVPPQTGEEAGLRSGPAYVVRPPDQRVTTEQPDSTGEHQPSHLHEEDASSLSAASATQDENSARTAGDAPAAPETSPDDKLQ